MVACTVVQPILALRSSLASVILFLDLIIGTQGYLYTL